MSFKVISHSGNVKGPNREKENKPNNILEVIKLGYDVEIDVLPALSCGMHPGLVAAINKRFGIDYMANVGGALHGHPGGTKSGVKAMRQSIDNKFSNEYDAAIKKWGIVE